MNFFEQQHRVITKDSVFKSSACSYIGRSCYIKLSNERLARLDFTTNGTHDNYECYEIAILDKNKGCIDKLRLLFKDYFAAQPGGCGGKTVPHIWIDLGEASWYKAPTSLEIKKLAQAAREYIALFE